MNILEELNESQRLAVEYCDGPQLVIAGAGSGKTRVLTYKIAYLLEHHGFKPWNILALTFTNKAAREMRERIGKLVGEEQARYLYMGTFHSIFSRILRREAERIGFNGNFTIYDESDSRSLIKSIIKELGLNDKVYKPATVHNRISMAKNHLILADDYANSRDLLQRDFEQRMPDITHVYSAYVARCRQANAMDFDDLLVYTYVLFNEHEDIRQKYVKQFAYVFVDEYQDTNSAQQRIVYQLTKERQAVCVVGDDAQSIYGFRGANIDNILEFTQLYDNARQFKLERNYRSTQRIVQAANSLIKHNQRQIPKDIYSRNDEGEKLVLKKAYSDKEEAIIVCKDIKRIRREDKCEYSDFAILYRTNAQSRSFEEAFRKENIPYRIYGGLSFYQRKEIKDIIAYFRVVVNPDDEEALKRIINYPTRGIGDTTVQKVAEAAMQHGVSLWSIVSNPIQYGLNVNKGTATRLLQFRDLISQFVGLAQTEDAYTVGARIIQESGIYQDLYSEKTPEALARQENLEEFLSGMQEFVESGREEARADGVSLTSFLQEVSLLTDLDSEEDDDAHRVSLMTVHSAKGLEFPTVFVVGLEENIFPSPLSTSSKRELEEERRLLYVAITRAERHCILTCARNRYRYGKMEFDTPSRFINDIDSKLLNVEGDENAAEVLSLWRDNKPKTDNFRSSGTQRPADRIQMPANRVQKPADRVQKPVNSNPQQPRANFRRLTDAVKSSRPTFGYHIPDLHEGNVIEHARFGVGEVVQVEGTGDNTMVTVEFRNAGRRKLLLKFATIKILG